MSIISTNKRLNWTPLNQGVSAPVSDDSESQVVAFGPEASDWGSWEWVGADVVHELGKCCEARSFERWQDPQSAIAVAIKHVPPSTWAAQVARDSILLFAPVDFYGGSEMVDADAPVLRSCARILVHCERLRKFFEPYARVEYMDHHVKFAAPLRDAYRTEGNLLWVGVRSNLPPLIRWVNAHPLALPLDVLTNLEDPTHLPTPEELGFSPTTAVTIHHWTPERHVAMTAAARAAIDIKGQDFRSRHKPPAKGIDFIASGLPLAMNPDSSTVEHLARMGFDVADPLDTDWWLSREYWEETRKFGAVLRELLSLERVGRRWKRIIYEVLAERGKGKHTGERNGETRLFNHRGAEGTEKTWQGIGSA
jgi:hypothetical protein